MSDIDSNDTTQTDETTSMDLNPLARREIMTKLVAVAALAATGLVSREANADIKSANKVATPNTVKLDKFDKVDKVEKWNETYKVFKDSAIKFVKLRTGFRVEIQATPELGSTLRSMGLVPATGDASAVKLSIEFSNS